MMRRHPPACGVTFLLTCGMCMAGTNPSSAPTTKPDAPAFTIRVGERDRRYVVHVPAGYDSKRSAPVVIMLHGAGGSAWGAARETGWIAKSDEAGFLLIFPEAMRPDPSRPAQFLRNPQIWNDGSGRAHAGRHNIDDVGFIRAMLDDLAARFAVDARRVFVTGFSNGASMTFRVGAELSDRVAAIAPVSGHFWLNNAKLTRPVPMLYIIGTTDPLNPLAGGEVPLPWGGVDRKAPIRDSVIRWAKLLGCPPEPRVLRDEGGVKIVAYGPGEDASEVLFCTVEGLGHTWPGGKSLLPERIVGKRSDRLDATALIWEFFQKHPKQ